MTSILIRYVVCGRRSLKHLNDIRKSIGKSEGRDIIPTDAKTFILSTIRFPPQMLPRLLCSSSRMFIAAFKISLGAGHIR